MKAHSLFQTSMFIILPSCDFMHFNPLPNRPPTPPQAESLSKSSGMSESRDPPFWAWQSLQDAFYPPMYSFLYFVV